MDAENLNYIIVYSTVDNKESAISISRKLVQERLAACCSIIPGLTSIYEWKGSLEESDEFMLMIKSKTTLFAQLVKRLKELHPYEVPEIISVAVNNADYAYASWMESCLNAKNT